MPLLVNNTMFPGRFNNYLVGGNVCNAFAMGELGSQDDFFLVGAEPPDESSYPLITGNILDSEGQPLCRIVRNVLTVNPGDCSKIVSDHIGYEIHDSAGQHIVAVRTQFERLPGAAEQSFVTTLSGNFYNQRGELVLEAHAGGADERLEANVKSAFGFAGGFGIVLGYSEPELDLARFVLATRGAVHELMTGAIHDRAFELSGKALIDAEVRRCQITVSDGDFYLRNSGFYDSSFDFRDKAMNIATLIHGVQGQGGGAQAA